MSRRCPAVLLLGCFAIAGCRGSADVRFLSLHPNAIDPPAPTVHSYGADECYWWLDDGGILNVALQATRRTLLPGRLGRIDLYMWYVLGEPPAGSGRNYGIRQRSMTAVLEAPLDTHSFNSYSGVVGITVRDDKRIEGSFRVWTHHRPGFSPFILFSQSAGHYLFFGRLKAVNDPQRGHAIREQCEPFRLPDATTVPATSRPSEPATPMSQTIAPATTTS
jgi:hypothetical protein